MNTSRDEVLGRNVSAKSLVANECCVVNTHIARIN